MRQICVFVEDFDKVQETYRYLHDRLVMDSQFKCSYPHRLEVEGWRISINVDDPLYFRGARPDLFYAIHLDTADYLKAAGSYPIENIDEIEKFVKSWRDI